MAIVFNAEKGKIKKVTNLGWLLRNWKRVESFTIVRFRGPYDSVHMYAWLGGGSYYSIDWASYSICLQWLKRPVFKGVKVETKGGIG